MPIPGFKKADWIHSTNIYEVNLRQYSEAGTMDAFLEALPRLRDMGVETLWFMPLTPISKKNRKGSLGSYYACSDYTSVNPEFGTMDNFKTLVKHAKGMGFRIIIDWVANHTGWDHVWTETNPEYYLRDTDTNDFKMAHGMDDIIELDYSNSELRHAMINAMEFWIHECDIDGFRCDLAFWVALDFWKEARAALDKCKPLFWLGEFDPVDDPGYYEAFDAAYTWSWMHGTTSFYRAGGSVSLLKQTLHQYDTICSNDHIPLWFTTNHDENSWNGTEYEKYGDMALALAVFSFTWSGMPMIYSGQELPNKKRLEFFEKDTISWSGENALHDFYKTLLQLHSRNPALRAANPDTGTLILQTNADEHILAWQRKQGNSEVVVVLNLCEMAMQVTISGNQLNGLYSDIFSRSAVNAMPDTIFELQPWAFLVLEK